MDEYSIVEIFEGQPEGHRCGYCKSTDGSLSYGMWAHSLTVKNYQDLIDRGWRRSGKYCYRPLMQQTCCPQYTIRCSVADFKLSKSQKKILRRMHRFLSVGQISDSEKNMKNSEIDGLLGPVHVMDVEQMQNRAAKAECFLDDKKLEKNLIENKAEDAKREEPSTSEAVKKNCENFETGKPETSSGNQKLPTKTGSGANADKPLRKKAKLLRLERKMEKLAKKAEKCSDQAINDEKMPKINGQANAAKTLQEYLSEPLPDNAAHNLEIKLVRSDPPSVEFRHSSNETYELYRRYQIAIHEDPPERCTGAQFERFLVNSPLEVTTLRCWPQSAEFRASAAESYSVYRQYQSHVHGEVDDMDFNDATYSEFLIESPLKGLSAASGSGHLGYGSFHQQYWLDGKLIAVGVVDILPACVSSVYFYYDPQYGFLSLGTYGALREIAYAQELSRISPEMRYYYMGFYIHTCVKMRYKGQFQPSYLLCPEVFTWHPIEKARIKLDENPYSRLEERSNIEDEDGKVGLSDVMVLHRRAALLFLVYHALRFRRSGDETREVLEYARHIGKKCARRTLLYRK